MVESVTARCLCGQNGGQRFERLGLEMLRCSCGIERQRIEMDEAGLARWYRDLYLNGIYYHSEEQDAEVARMRLRAYDFIQQRRILDVGAANGAFVEAALKAGHDAWGQDLARQSRSRRIYVGRLHDIAFSAASFEVVTCHDVLEHVPRPRAFLEEIARILEPGGRLLVDFPRFHAPEGEGAHHWKPTEHLWMLTDEQLEALLEDCGFRVQAIRHPVPSKTVLDCRNENEASSATILVPPGIGDGYWVAAKLPAFLEEHGLRLPKVLVHDSGPRRAGGFWDALPFVRFGGYQKIPRGFAWDQAYRPPGVAVQEAPVPGIDFFLSFNGVLDGGRTLDDALPGRTNWYPRLFRSKERLAAGQRFAEGHAPYVLCAFWDRGFYEKAYLPKFPEPRVLETLRRLADAGLTVVIMGASFDRGGIGSRLAAADERFVDLIGETSVAELFGLVESASAVLGFPAGNTLLGPFLGTPTILLWGDHFPKSFRSACAPPDASYAPISLTRAEPGGIAAEVLGMAR